MKEIVHIQKFDFINLSFHQFELSPLKLSILGNLLFVIDEFREYVVLKSDMVNFNRYLANVLHSRHYLVTFTPYRVTY